MDVRILIKIDKGIFILPLALYLRFIRFIFFIMINLIFAALLCLGLSSFKSFLIKCLLKGSCGLILVLGSSFGLVMPSLGRLRNHDLYSSFAAKMEYYLPFHKLKITAVNSFFIYKINSFQFLLFTCLLLIYLFIFCKFNFLFVNSKFFNNFISFSF